MLSIRKPHKMLGMDGGLVIEGVNINGGLSSTISKQAFVSRPRTDKDGIEYAVRIRFDDPYRNKHHRLAVELTRRGDNCYADFDTVLGLFPEVQALVKWKNMTSKGPDGLNNVAYLAGNRDCWGRAAGEPSLTEVYAFFGDHPIGFHIHTFLEKGVRAWFASNPDPDSWVVNEIPAREADKYEPSFEFKGMGLQWAPALFETRWQAEAFREAAKQHTLIFKAMPLKFSKGKVREFEDARHAAMWPDAPEEILMLPKVELEKHLEEHSKKLVAEFRKEMTGLGFWWPQWIKSQLEGYLNVYAEFPDSEDGIKAANDLMEQVKTVGVALEENGVVYLARLDDLGNQLELKA